MTTRSRYLGSLVAALLAPCAVSAAARAQFVPGRVYVSQHAVEPCPQPPGFPDDRIWEVDPQTGQYHVFVTVPPSQGCQMTGLAFTPDGTGLRASMRLTHTIVQVNGAGTVQVVLGPADGLAWPLGSNNMAYDSAGNFFVANALTNNILEFPAGGGPASVFADIQDGINAAGSLAFDPSGDLYVTNSNRQLLRFTPSGEGVIFDQFPQPSYLNSVAVDSAGNVFLYDLSSNGSLYRYDGGDPATRHLLASGFPLVGGAGAIALSPDQASVYVIAGNRLVSVGAQTGQVSLLATVPTFYTGAGYGIAVYVPEPGTLALLISGLALLTRRRRGAAHV